MIGVKVDCMNPSLSPLSLKIGADCIFPLVERLQLLLCI